MIFCVAVGGGMRGNMNIITKAIRIFAEKEEIIVASVNEKGFPRACVLSKIKSEGIKKFWVATGLDSIKVKHFKENPKASACFYEGGNSITLIGKVSVLNDPEIRTKMWLDWFINHFPGGINDPNYCILEFETEEATLWIDEEFITITGMSADSRCGLHCTGCLWKESNGCRGCIDTMGQPFYGECKIARCCQEKGLNHCGECNIIPCKKLYAYSYLDSEHGDKPQGKRIMDCRKWAAVSGKQVWEKVLLTSAGFENMEGKQKSNIVSKFKEMLDKPWNKTKVLFIPTAAIDKVAKEMVDKCRNELLNLGILKENIEIFNLEGSLSLEEAMKYDVIYFTGGNTEYLLRRIKETGFDEIIKRMVYANKVYVGVSAGSLIATPNIGDPFCEESSGIALMNGYLSVHCSEGKNSCEDLNLPHIYLTDNQAIAVNWAGYEIIEG